MQLVSGGARVVIDEEALFRKAGGADAFVQQLQDRGLWLGLAGGIGAGKSAVSAVWRSLGATIADGDAIAREIVTPGQRALLDIAARFGGDVLTNGELNRGALATIVFNDESSLSDLNALTHPRIWARAEQVLSEVPAGSIGVYDAAILIGSEGEAHMDAVAAVVANSERRVARLVNQRGMNEQDARARIARQMSEDELRAHASIVIENEGSISDLQDVAKRVYDYLIALIQPA